MPLVVFVDSVDPLHLVPRVERALRRTGFHRQAIEFRDRAADLNEAECYAVCSEYVVLLRRDAKFPTISPHS